MHSDLKNKHFLTLKDFSQDAILSLLDFSVSLKEKNHLDGKGSSLFKKNIVLLFDKPSTRTHCAFEVAAYDEGANVTFLSNSHMGHKESVEDTAKILGRLYDGIGFRGFDHGIVETLALHSGVPVWNGLTDRFHPTQVLADLLTLREKVNKPLHQIKLVFVGNPRSNVARSLRIGSTKMGMHFVVLAPRSHWPSESVIKSMREFSRKTDGLIEFYDVIGPAVKEADVIYTDVWISMGEEEACLERIKCLSHYQVDMDMLEKTGNSDIIFMHCLPAFHGLNTMFSKSIYEKFKLGEMEVTDEVFRSKFSVVFDQAENRLHTIKAVMLATISKV